MTDKSLGGYFMANTPKYYIIEASALPEVFLKVAEAKRLLSVGKVRTVNRSAFYKYRDCILPFQSMMNGRVITFQFMLQDQPGLLSNILAVFAEHNANIQTINSISPSNGTALVTISAETMDLNIHLEDLLHRLSQVPGVIKADVIAS